MKYQKEPYFIVHEIQFNHLCVLSQLSHSSKWPNTCTDAQAKYNVCLGVGVGGGDRGRGDRGGERYIYAAASSLLPTSTALEKGKAEKQKGVEVCREGGGKRKETAGEMCSRPKIVTRNSCSRFQSANLESRVTLSCWGSVRPFLSYPSMYFHCPTRRLPLQAARYLGPGGPGTEREGAGEDVNSSRAHSGPCPSSWQERGEGWL